MAGYHSPIKIPRGPDVPHQVQTAFESVSDALRKEDGRGRTHTHYVTASETVSSGGVSPGAANTVLTTSGGAATLQVTLAEGVRGVYCRRDRGEWHVVVRAGDWEEMLRRSHGQA